MILYKNLLVINAIIIITSCKNSLPEKGSQQYLAEIKAFHAKRIENLKRENGWLNLIGLFWLKEGSNSFGSADSCDIIFPKDKCPAVMGNFILNNGSVMLRISKGIDVTSGGKKITELEMKNDTEGKPTVYSYCSLRWFVIKRGNSFGIRLRDLGAPLLKNFQGIKTYPINSDWKFEAEFVKYNPPKIISVPNILGRVDKENSPGYLTFQKDGNKYKLEVLDEGDSYFIVFADKTNGIETYGGGRFLYTSKEDSTDHIIVDFNKAYNPPCAFTKFATCPLPPRQNYLELAVTAGEKVYDHNH